MLCPCWPLWPLLRLSSLQALMQQHEKAFADMKGYFNGVVRDNLDAIMALKAELAEHKRREASTQSLLQEVVAENRRLSEPLDKVSAAWQMLLLLLCVRLACIEGRAYCAGLGYGAGYSCRLCSEQWLSSKGRAVVTPPFCSTSCTTRCT